MCDTCGSGEIPNVDRTGCSRCVGANEYKQDGVCNKCNGVTEWLKSDRSGCTACDGDKEAHTGNNLNTCITCTKGYYATLQHGACSGGCEPGYFCSSETANGCDRCTVCPAGYACPGRVVENGVITSFGAKEECEKGSYSGSAQSACSECPIGYTTDSTGSVRITACKAQTVVLKIGVSNVSLPACLKTDKINKDIVK